MSGSVVEQTHCADVSSKHIAWTDNRESTRYLGIYYDQVPLGTPPTKPTKPDGPTSGGINTEHTYSTSATDPDGDQIYYVFDWGDGTSDEFGPFDSGATGSGSHAWAARGDYNIKVKARDTVGLESDWSDPLSASMPRARQVTHPLLQKLIETFPNVFLLLRHLL